MRFIDLLQMSVTNLLKRKVRTLLTVLGVVIGTTSIVVMVSLGIGLKTGIMKEIESYASLTTVTVSQRMDYDSVSSKNNEDGFLDDDLIQSLKGMEHVVDVSPVLSVNATLKCGRYVNDISLIGMTTKALEQQKFELAQGELPADDKEMKLLFGNTVLGNFYIEKTGRNPYWEEGTPADINLMDDKMYLIYNTSNDSDTGAQEMSGSVKTTGKKLKKYDTKVSGVIAGGLDDWNKNSYKVFCNIDALKSQLKRVFKKKVIPGQPTTKAGKPYKEIYYTELLVDVDEMSNVVGVTKAISEMGYEAYNDAEWIEAQMKQMNYIQAVLGAIGAVSLLVAAIGITNTMMMSIYERTKEIGVMKVLGCDIRNIQEMFLLEAGFIGFLGGVVGIILSYGLSFMINQLVKNSAMGLEQLSLIPLWLPLPAIGFAILIGMVAGFIPSLRAMRLSPLSAIHTE